MCLSVDECIFKHGWHDFCLLGSGLGPEDIVLRQNTALRALAFQQGDRHMAMTMTSV